MLLQKKIKFGSNEINTILILFLLSLSLLLTRFYSYNLFHSFAEIFSIIIAFLIFVISWNARKIIDNNFLLFIGIVYLFIGIIDLVHTLAFPGMGVFIGYGTNLATQLWIVARYMESISLLIAAVFIKRKLKANYVFSFYLLISILLFLSIFYWSNFPVSYIENEGLTDFKIRSEVLIIFFLAMSIYFLMKNRRSFDRSVFNYLIASILLTIFSEMSFTLYAGPFDYFNLLGHIFKVMSFYLIYQAIIVTGFTKPYKLLFRDLKNEKDKTQTYLDIAGVILISVDADRKVTMINKNGCELLGFKKEQIIGSDWFGKFIPEDDREKTIDAFERLISGDITETINFENRVLTSSGEERIIYWTNNIIRGKNGEIISTISSGTDITDRRKDELKLIEALKKAERRKNETLSLLEGSRAILEHHDFNSAAKSIFDSCKKIIGAQSGYVALLSQIGTENEVIFLDSGGLPCNVNPDLPMPIRGLRKEVYETGITKYDNNFNKSKWMEFIPEGHVNLENVLFAPLFMDKKCVGLIGLANKPGGFNDNDARLAGAFSELAAIALKNSINLEALEDNEERFRSVAKTASDAIISINSDGKIIFINDSAQKMFGYSESELLNQTLGLIIPDEFKVAHRDGLKRLYNLGKPRILGKTVELIGVRRNNKRFPIELSIATWSLRGEQFFTGIIRDITIRKQSENQLRSERDRAKMYFDTAGAIMLVLDKNHRVTLVNRKGCQILQYPVEDILEKEWFDEFVSEKDRERTRANFMNIMNNTNKKYDTRYLYSILTNNGEEKIIAWHTVELRDHEGNIIGTLNSGEDVTMQKQAEIAIKEAYENLEQKVEERTKKLSYANKQLKKEIRERVRIQKTLLINQRKLRSMSSKLSLAEEKERRHIAIELHDSIGQTLALLKIKIAESKSTAISNDVINQLTEIIKIIDETIIETRTLAFDLSSPILYTLGLEAAIERLSEKIQTEHNISCHFNDDKEEKKIDDDISILLFQSVRELLINVVKHAKAKNIEISVQKDSECILIQILDDGVGFNIEKVGDYWEKNGGFGLFSIRERIDNIKGSFQIESNKKSGTKVSLKAPLKQ